MNINDFMLLIITVAAAVALIGQNRKLSCPELITFRAGNAVYLPFELFARKFRLKRLLLFIRAVVLPIRSRLRIAAGWGKRYAARASTVETGYYFYTLCRRIRAYACDIFAAYSKNAASWRFRAPKKRNERMCGEHRFLAESSLMVVS